MRHLVVSAFVTLATLCLTVTPVGAGVLIGRPGQLPSGYIHLTAYAVADRVLDMIDTGELNAGDVTMTTTGIVLSGTPPEVLIEAGVIHEFYVDRFDQVLRYDDPAWAAIVPETWETEWQAAYWSGS